jgi:hypothetical protein
MAHCDHPIEIEIVYWSKIAQLIDGHTHIRQCVWIAAAWVSSPLVFGMPRRDAGLYERIAHVLHEIKSKEVKPTSTMNNDGNRFYERFPDSCP